MKYNKLFSYRNFFLLLNCYFFVGLAQAQNYQKIYSRCNDPSPSLVGDCTVLDY